MAVMTNISPKIPKSSQGRNVEMKKQTEDNLPVRSNKSVLLSDTDSIALSEIPPHLQTRSRIQSARDKPQYSEGF